MEKLACANREGFRSRKDTTNKWKAGLICPIDKKVDKMNCNNYRGITLLNVTDKIHGQILLNRLEPYTHPFVNFNQHMIQ